jgi:GWxTD domain-containing protein
MRGRRSARWVVLGAVLIGAAGCQWQRVGTDTGPDPSVVVPALFDPTALYTRMGFLASGPPVAYVATLRYFGSDVPDTTLAVFGLSMANDALGFRIAGDLFEARYTVEVSVRRAGTVLTRLSAEERVRVASREEARRADESVIFQELLRLVPGTYDVVVSVRDELSGGVGRVERSMTVPRFPAAALAAPVPVYQVAGRAQRGDPPAILLNPRGTVPFGLDTLRLYLEAYGATPGAPARFVLIGPAGDIVLRRDVAVAGDASLAWATVAFVPDELPVGELRVLVSVDGLPDTTQQRTLVSFSEQWAITNFDEILTLLRFFGQDRAIAEMRAAPPAERPDLWRAFWRGTDPNPLTPQNEALDLYFRRVQEANQRFGEAGEPGWSSERGEVFITLGEPDEIFDRSSDLQGPLRIIRWNYLGERLTLDFVDDTGFGRYRLTPASRAEYQRVLNMVRSGG